MINNDVEADSAEDDKKKYCKEKDKTQAELKTAEFQKKEMRNFIQEFNKYPSLIKEINQVER